MKTYFRKFILAGCLIGMPLSLSAQEARKAPTLTIPKVVKAPTVDGKLADGEWDNAAATTGLISQFGKVAHPRQVIYWLAYDKENVYVACQSTLYPEEEKPKSPQTWFKRDSSVVVGLAPNRINRGVTASHYLIRANIDRQFRNREIFWLLEGGGKRHGYQDVKLRYPHPAWSSGTKVKQTIGDGMWTLEMSIPLADMKAADLKDGETWGLLLGRDYSAADQTALTLSSDWRFGDGNRHYGLAFYNQYRYEKEYAKVKFGGIAPAVQVLDLGRFTNGKASPTIAVTNTTDKDVQVKLHCEYRIAYGIGGNNHPETFTLNLAPGERKMHTFTPVDLPPGEPSICVIKATGPGGDLLSQEITLQPNWGRDRAKPMPEPYFCGYHLGKTPTIPLPTCYNPIANRVYGRIRPSQVPNGHLVAKAELTVLRSGDKEPVVTIPIKGKPDYRITFHDVSYWRSPPATVLEWVAPAAGTVDIDMEFMNAYAHKTQHKGEALRVLHYDSLKKKVTVIVPRVVNNDHTKWDPITKKGLKVNAGDKIHFYHDRNINAACDDANLRGTLTLTQANGEKTIYNPGGEFTLGKQGGSTGVWFYCWDNVDSKPNPDGKYPKLPWEKRYNHLKQKIYPEAFVANAPNKSEAYQARIGRKIVGTDWILDAKLPKLSPGVYEATVTLYSAEGQVLGRARQNFIRYDHKKDLPWLGNKVGVSNKVLPPWTPIKTKKAKANSQNFSIWGRDYSVDGSGLFTSIKAVAQIGLDQSKHEVLAGPARYEIMQDGKFTALTSKASPADVKAAGHEASWKGLVSSNGWKIKTDVTLEYDGYALHKIRIEPPAGKANKLERLRLVIPLKTEYAKYLHAAGGGHFRGTVATMKLEKMVDRQSTYDFQHPGMMWNSQLITAGGAKPGNTLVKPRANSNPYFFPYGVHAKMTLGSFRPYVWVGSAERGLAFMADNDQGWVPDDPMKDHKFRGFVKVPHMEIIHEDAEVQLILNLVARPFTFDKPREISFSLQATPIRPVPDDVRERQKHIAMGTAFPGGRHGGTGWGWAGQMYNIKDNLDPKKPGAWLFGLPGSALYPANWDMSAWYRKVCQDGKGFHADRYAYTPYQSQICVMTWPEVEDPRMPAGLQNGNTYGYIYPHISGWYMDAGSSNLAREDMEYRIWNYKNWIEHTKLEGMYFDQTQPTLAANPVAGLGYRLDLPDRPKLHGKVQPGFGLMNIREMYKRLRTLFVENGVDEPYIFIHTTDANMLSAFSFGLYFLEGENYPYITRKIPISKKISPSRQQAMRGSAGGMVLLQMEMANFLDRMIYRDITGYLMLHDTFGSGMANIWYKWAGLDVKRKATFLPYWSPDVAKVLKSSTKETYASAWLQDNALRVLVYNRNDEAASTKVELNLKGLGLKTAGKTFTAVELEPPAQPKANENEKQKKAREKRNAERGPGELSYEADGDKMTVTVEALPRNFRLFRIEAK